MALAGERISGGGYFPGNVLAGDGKRKEAYSVLL
jgi:hypothetical protein